MKWMMLYGLCWMFCEKGISQLAHLPVSTGDIRSGAYSTHFADAFSFAANAASLGAAKEILCGLSLERKWMLKELNHYELAGSFGRGHGGIGVALAYSGDADYHEQAIKLAYGKNLGKLEVGIFFNYLNNQAAGYSSIGYGYCGAGIRFHVSEKLISGWELSLPVMGQLGKQNPETGPRQYALGFGYEANASLFMAAQLVKESGVPMNLIVSVEYRYADQFLFSFGIESGIGSPYFKTGWKKNQLCIQLYSVYHPVLGFSPGLQLLWQKKNKK